MIDGILIKSGGGGRLVSSTELDATSAYVAKGKTYVGADTDDQKGVGNLALLSSATFGSNAADAWSTSPIVSAEANAYVGGFSYNLDGYFKGDTRVHIPNAIPANIRGGVQIGGPQGAIQGTFTQDATATSADILAGKSAGIQGSMQTGTMPNRGSAVPSVGRGVNGYGLYYYIPKGYYSEGANNPWVYSTQGDVATAIGLSGYKMIKGASCLGINGSVDWVYTTAESLVDTDINPAVYSLSNLDFYEGNLIWQGSVHPEWPYVIFDLGGRQLILGKGGTWRQTYKVSSGIVSKYTVSRDESGYCKFYVAATSSASLHLWLDCIGGTTADING